MKPQQQVFTGNANVGALLKQEWRRMCRFSVHGRGNKKCAKLVFVDHMARRAAGRQIVIYDHRPEVVKACRRRDYTALDDVYCSMQQTAWVTVRVDVSLVINVYSWREGEPTHEMVVQLFWPASPDFRLKFDEKVVCHQVNSSRSNHGRTALLALFLYPKERDFFPIDIEEEVEQHPLSRRQAAQVAVPVIIPFPARTGLGPNARASR